MGKVKFSSPKYFTNGLKKIPKKFHGDRSMFSVGPRASKKSTENGGKSARFRDFDI